MVWFNVGDDTQGFPMKQGVRTHGQVHLLFSKRHCCTDQEARTRKNQSVRGCTVNAMLREDPPGLTGVMVLKLLAQSANVSVSKDNVHQDIEREPFNKGGETQVPQSYYSMRPAMPALPCC